MRCPGLLIMTLQEVLGYRIRLGDFGILAVEEQGDLFQ